MLENTYLYIVYFLHLQFFINYFNILLFVCIYVLCFTLKYMIGSYILPPSNSTSKIYQTGIHMYLCHNCAACGECWSVLWWIVG